MIGTAGRGRGRAGSRPVGSPAVGRAFFVLSPSIGLDYDAIGPDGSAGSGVSGTETGTGEDRRMTLANWKTQSYNGIQSLLFNNPHRVVEFHVAQSDGGWRNRAELPAPVRRLYETEAPEERTCLQTTQFVHHMMIPPGGRHVAELHIHPDAEEILVVTRGEARRALQAKAIRWKGRTCSTSPPEPNTKFVTPARIFWVYCLSMCRREKD